MAINRLGMVLLASGIWMLACSTSSAVDINANTPTGVEAVGEATAFFNRLINTSTNPIIINMARENLKKLRNPDERSLAALYVSPPAGQQGFESSILASSPKTLTEVPLVPQSDNTYVVPAVVNQRHSATFLVDTGASYTVITPRMARQLGLHLTEDSATVPVTTANGVVHAPLVTLKQLALGELQVNNVEAVVADLGDSTPISGLLGMSFFHGMELSFKHDHLLIGR